MIIGITGSIGVGKSEAFKLIQKEIGELAEYIDADAITHYIYEKKEVKDFLNKEFNTINRKEIAKIVFSDKKSLEKINTFMHKSIIEEINERIKKSNKKYIFADIPLLYELKLEYMFDKIIVVYASRDVQISRIMLRNNLSKDDAIKRIDSQIDIEEKRKKADYVIENMITIEKLKFNVDKILKKIMEEDDGN